ncbi:uncharacterized protein ACIQIH_012541 [Cyanocitta cristata]
MISVTVARAHSCATLLNVTSRLKGSGDLALLPSRALSDPTGSLAGEEGAFSSEAVDEDDRDSRPEPPEEDEDEEGVSAGRTSPAPLVVPARKPSSHRRGPPRGRNKPTGVKKSLEKSRQVDQTLSDLERRREMEAEAVLKAAFPGGSSGSLAASAAGREAMPGTGTGDWDQDMDYLESLLDDGLKTSAHAGAEPLGEAASQPTSTTEPQGEDEDQEWWLFGEGRALAKPQEPGHFPDPYPWF